MRCRRGVGIDPFVAALVLVGVAGAVVLTWLGRPALLSGGEGKLPRRFEVKALDRRRGIPVDARQPLAYLSERLTRLGFDAADPPMRVPSASSWGRHLVLVPFVHAGERALFVMGIESRLVGGSPLMLHILTPLQGGRRVETTTLPGLEAVALPPEVELRVVLDANTVEEMWSRHRRALTEFERDLRERVEPSEWRRHAAAAYESWLSSALRSNRLELDPAGDGYRIRTRRRRPSSS